MQICHPITLATAAALLVGSALAHAAEPLSALGVDITQTSVSGISSGAYMAGQFHLAFSTIVVGAGVVAGGPWGCASNGSGDSLLLGSLDNATRALAGCMQVTGGAPDGGALAEAAKAFAHKHRIDPLSGLEGDRVYLFHGESDSVVATPVTTAAEAFYRTAGITAADMHAVYHLPGGKVGHSRSPNLHGRSDCMIGSRGSGWTAPALEPQSAERNGTQLAKVNCMVLSST